MARTKKNSTGGELPTIVIAREGWLFPKIIRRPESEPFKVPVRFKFHEAKPSQLEEMDAAIVRSFRSKLDMFPLVGDEAPKPGFLYPFTGRPSRFFEIFEAYIVDAFPDEEEAREYVRDYRWLYWRNQVVFVTLKRAFLAIALVLAAAPFASSAAGDNIWQWIQQQYPWILASLGAFTFGHAGLHNFYRESFDNSSSHVSNVAQRRLADLRELFDTVLNDIDRGFPHIGRDPDAWNEQAKFLTRLTLFVGRRVEFFERFMQVEMWRVRRIRHWTLLYGTILLLAVVGIYSAIFLDKQLVEFVDEGWNTPGLRMLLPLHLTYVVALSMLSMRWGRVTVTAARDAMQPDGWKRFADIELDEQIGSQVGRDKKLIAQHNQENVFVSPQQRGGSPQQKQPVQQQQRAGRASTVAAEGQERAHGGQDLGA